MTSAPGVVFSVSAAGQTVAEAEVADADGARALLAAARAAGAQLAWAHSHADLAPLGFRPQPGYRRSEAPAFRGPAGTDAGHVPPGQLPDHVGVLAPEEDSAALWARVFRGQWGHKTPQDWPLDLPEDTITLCLRRDGEIAGLVRVEPATGLIDAPGLAPGFRAPDGYRRLLTAALGAAAGRPVTVESWGEPAELTAVAEDLGLVTAEYMPGWELDLLT
ncbi:MAG: hypothetical protein ACR2FU_02705 [Streptosporangiaceae bacterium]